VNSSTGHKIESEGREIKRSRMSINVIPVIIKEMNKHEIDESCQVS
jgi:hypothetical protein